jgi:hypothetical protein
MVLSSYLASDRMIVDPEGSNRAGMSSNGERSAAAPGLTVRAAAYDQAAFPVQIPDQNVQSIGRQ